MGAASAVRAFIVTALAAGVLLFAGIPMFLHPTTAYTGVHLRLARGLIQRPVVSVDAGSPAYRAGLRSGDVLSCLSLLDANLLFARSDGIQLAYAPGTPITACVQRNGAWRRVQFAAQVRPPAPSSYGNDTLAAIRLAEYAVFVLCGAILVLGRPGLMTWLFFLYVLAASPGSSIIANLSTLPAPLYALAISVIGFSEPVAGGLLLLFAVLVPNDRPPPGWRTIAYRCAWGVVLALALLSTIGWQTNWALAMAPILMRLAAVTAAVVLVIVARLFAMEREERARFGWAAFAIGWSVLIDLFRIDSVDIAVHLPAIAAPIASLFSVITPIALMYAILRRHVIDVRFVLSRTVIYAAITTFAVGVIGVVDWATSVYLHDAHAAMVLDALVTIGVAFALNRVHRWIEYAVDFLLFRKKYEAENYLNRLAKTLVNASHEETVHRELVRAPYRRLDLTMAALFQATESTFVRSAVAGSEEVPAAFERDHELVRFLTTERARVQLRDLTPESAPDAAIALPLFQGNELTGFALYGNHRDGTRLDPDEVETLQRLCEAGAQAYTLIAYARYRALEHPSLAQA